MVIKNRYVLLVTGIVSLSYASDKYTIVYDSVEDIRELVEQTFLTHVTEPDSAQIFQPKDFAKVNDIILAFVQKKNKTLGIKNDDIDAVAKQFHSILNELINEIKVLSGTMYKIEVLNKNAPSIILKLQDIYDQFDILQAKINALLSKKISLITANGKKLLKMYKETIKDVKMFDSKVELMIRHTLE